MKRQSGQPSDQRAVEADVLQILADVDRDQVDVLAPRSSNKNEGAAENGKAIEVRGVNIDHLRIPLLE